MGAFFIRLNLDQRLQEKIGEHFQRRGSLTVLLHLIIQQQLSAHSDENPEEYLYATLTSTSAAESPAPSFSMGYMPDDIVTLIKTAFATVVHPLEYISIENFCVGCFALLLAAPTLPEPSAEDKLDSEGSNNKDILYYEKAGLSLQLIIIRCLEAIVTVAGARNGNKGNSSDDQNPRILPVSTSYFPNHRRAFDIFPLALVSARMCASYVLQVSPGLSTIPWHRVALKALHSKEVETGDYESGGGMVYSQLYWSTSNNQDLLNELDGRVEDDYNSSLGPDSHRLGRNEGKGIVYNRGNILQQSSCNSLISYLCELGDAFDSLEEDEHGRREGRGRDDTISMKVNCCNRRYDFHFNEHAIRVDGSSNFKREIAVIGDEETEETSTETSQPWMPLRFLLRYSVIRHLILT